MKAGSTCQYQKAGRSSYVAESWKTIYCISRKAVSTLQYQNAGRNSSISESWKNYPLEWKLEALFRITSRNSSVSESWKNYPLEWKLEALFSIRKLAGTLLYQRAGRLSFIMKAGSPFQYHKQEFFCIRELVELSIESWKHSPVSESWQELFCIWELEDYLYSFPVQRNSWMVL